jgi:hypothetical protein
MWCENGREEIGDKDVRKWMGGKGDEFGVGKGKEDGRGIFRGGREQYKEEIEKRGWE